MNPPRKKTSDGIGWPFRDSSNEGETNIAMNQRMVARLVERKKKIADLPNWQSRSYIALGIEVSQSREERTGKSMQEAAKHSGLDPGFLALVEAGKVTEDELTGDVIKALARSVNAKVSDLMSAMSVQESEHSRDTAGQLVQAVLSLCQPSILSTAGAYKSIHFGRGRPPAGSSTHQQAISPMNASGPLEDRDNVDMLRDSYQAGEQDSFSDLCHDERAGISYQMGGLSRNRPLSLRLCELREPDTPLKRWDVTVKNGCEELAAGVTDDQGVYEFPEGVSDFPANAHMLIEKSG